MSIQELHSEDLHGGAAAEVPEDEKTRPKSLKFKLTVFFLCTVAIVGAMDAVIVGACLAAIAADLESTSIEAFWVGTSFLLAQTVMIPIYGTVSEIFGRKWPILIAVSIFTFASILCATAENIAWLIAARVVQGIGAGGMIQLVQVILSDISTMSERGLYVALAALAWAFGTNIGIPIGGAIAERTTWRWVFWINIPICTIAIFGLAICLQLQQDTSSFIKKLRRIDWLGLSLFTGATTLFLVGLTSGGVAAPWDSARVLVPLIIGFLLYPVFIYVEWRVSPVPMVPLRIFGDRAAITGYVTSFLQGLIVWCLAYYFILFFLGALQHGLLHSSLEVMTTMAYIAPAAIVTSVLIKRTQRFKYLITIGWVFLAAGLGSNVTMRPDSSLAVIYAPRCLASIGAGILFPTPLFAVQAGQLGDDVGIATSIQVFARSLGTAFGVGLGGVIFQNEWTIHVNEGIVEQRIPENLIISSDLAEIGYEIIRQYPESVQEAYRWVYSDSLATIWWAMTGLSIVGFLISLVCKNHEIKGGLSGKQNFRNSEPTKELKD
ncbi:major facilitator superfamily domain-containing protein [Stachybotrys elegans]|uniref:Major facilitator superfamily domain-containing protein n=1 Tax=Stachybotrys elegans TaxID=80388 RepID=A0A8K0SAJ1_9HYPO|nr:major facilitator superfamily domain-containing protein [Stachybotrys elegans]